MQYEKKKVRRLKDLKKPNNFVSNNFENVVPPKLCPGYALMKCKIPCIFFGHFKSQNLRNCKIWFSIKIFLKQ